VFGPVLHVVRWRRGKLDALIEAIDATHYALTFGVHTRIDETIARLTTRVAAGNCYVNRNLIGAVVGVQPFGGHRLSGTGPKAGGPLSLLRLLATRPAPTLSGLAPPAAGLWAEWLATRGQAEAAARCAALAARSPLGATLELAGPVGERNTWSLEPRGDVLCLPATEFGLALQVGAALATGNRALVALPGALEGLPEGLRDLVVEDEAGTTAAAALHEGDADALRDAAIALAAREGPLVALHGASSQGLADGSESYPLEWLVRERSVSTNTAAAGGNASLMTLAQ
jgi:RHH-type proline utilization regulon transcriptional repressor/proline dehydrogenase/delta 1-pyrroline-5-carboxylate dehydrogenase